MSLRYFLSCLAYGLVCTANWMMAVAHEGHQPLPSKGVLVDTKTGHVTLSRQARDAIGIQTEEIHLSNVSSSVTAYAEAVVPWQNKAFGSAQISGKIVKLLVRPGDVVVKDQIVAELSSRELESLRQDYAQATREVRLNSQVLELTRPAAQTGAIPMQRLLEIENAFQQSSNALQIARVRAQILGIPLNDLDIDETRPIHHFIRSPISGKVIHSDLSEGQSVEAFEHLFEIVGTDEIWIRIQLLEKDIPKVQTGQTVSLDFGPNYPKLDATVKWLDIALDPQTRICWAWATLSKANIPPGMVGKATIQTSVGSNQVTVPQSAIFSDGLQSYVFVEEASTRESAEYRKRNIKLGDRRRIHFQQSSEYIEILQGDIYPGDRIVVRGGHELSSLFFLGVLKLSDKDKKRLGIVTHMASEKSIQRIIELPAIVSLPPESRSVVTSQLNGTIRAHTLSPGRVVRKGEVLLEIASPEFCALQIDLIKTILASDLSRERSKRLSELNTDALSRRVFLEIQAEAERLESRAEGLKRQLLSLGLSRDEVNDIASKKEIMNYLPIRASLDGHISRWEGNLGETVTANQKIAEIQNLRSLWIESYISTQQFGSLKPSATGTARLLSNAEYHVDVMVARISPIVNSSTRTQKCWLNISSEKADLLLKEGMLLTALIRSEPGPKGLSVPVSAVIRDGLQNFVFVEKRDGYFERRRVNLGRFDDQVIEIVQGITAGESVVSLGGRELQTAFASLR